MALQSPSLRCRAQRDMTVLDFATMLVGPYQNSTTFSQTAVEGSL